MSIFKVGIMSDVRFVEAPNALAAAVFYGIEGTNGNCQFMAAVYEQDGKPYEGDRTPAMRWHFGGDPSEAELNQLKADLPMCRFVEKSAIQPPEES